jgi:hypothetical protein
VAALGTPNHLALCCRLGTALAACYPGIGFAEFESTLRALDNVFELHIYISFKDFIKVTQRFSYCIVGR